MDFLLFSFFPPFFLFLFLLPPASNYLSIFLNQLESGQKHRLERKSYSGLVIAKPHSPAPHPSGGRSLSSQSPGPSPGETLLLISCKLRWITSLSQFQLLTFYWSFVLSREYLLTILGFSLFSDFSDILGSLSFSPQKCWYHAILWDISSFHLHEFWGLWCYLVSQFCYGCR